MKGDADVIVIGGGVVGVTAAVELAGTGAKVLLLEAVTVGQGCSFGNAGLICPSHSSPLASGAALLEGIRSIGRADTPLCLHPNPRLLPWLARFVWASRPRQVKRAADLMHRMSLTSLALYRELAASGLEFGFEECGILDVYETSAGLTAAATGQSRRHGTAHTDFLVGDAARCLAPALAPHISGAVLHENEAYCEPATLVRALADAGRSRGLTIEPNITVRRLRVSGGRVKAAEADGRSYEAETFVLAAGVATRSLARSAGIHLPVEGGKGYHVDLPRAEGDPEIPLFLQEARVVVTPFADRVRVSGTLEFGSGDPEVSPPRTQVIRRSAERAVPALRERRVIASWAGFRPCAADGLPIIGRPERVQGLIIATAHAMLGLTLAPITGRLVRELVVGNSTSIDVALLAPSRFERFRPTVFGGRRTGGSSS